MPKVTPAAVDDAINTIRKRTDVLGVSEPEIQRSGSDQISVGLPDVQNAERAIQQVGTTAQLQFYDWEPNVLGRGADSPYAGSKALFAAAEAASKEKPKAEATDVPPGSDLTPAQADRQNDSTTTPRYYLFGPDELPIGPDKKPVRTGDYDPGTSCKEALSDFDPGPGKAPEYAKGTACADELKALGSGGPPAGSRIIEVPRGITIVEAERVDNQPAQIKRFFVLEDDTELNGTDIKNPKAQSDPQTNAPVVTMEFTDKGREAFARVTKRIADRGSKIIPQAGTPRDQTFQRFAITLDNKIVSLATIDYVQNPEGIDGRTGAQIENIGDIGQTNDLAENLRIGALPIELKLISNTQVSATLGKQALHQGLLAGLAGLLLTIAFLIVFYRVLGLVATAALGIYGVLLFAVIKLLPITLTLPGIAGMVLTLAVAADANIVMFERIKEEVRGGQVDTRGHLHRLHEGAAHDHRRQRGDDRRGLHPVHARHRRHQGLRPHAADRHARVAVHRGARHLGDPGLDGAQPDAAASQRARGQGELRPPVALRLHGQVALVLLLLGSDPGRGRDRHLHPRDQLRHRLRVGHPDHHAARAGRRAPTTCARR